MSEHGFIWSRDGEIKPREGSHWAVPDISVEVNEGWLLFTCRTCKAEALVVRAEAEKSTAHIIAHKHGRDLQVMFQNAGRN
jgi:hypothetical protein